MTLKQPIAGSEALLERVKQALTPDRLPLLIGVDGADGIGKSSLASWLAWQLGMPAVHLDLYLTGTTPIRWLTFDLALAVNRRLDAGRPVIVDGVLLLDALDKIIRKPNFLVFVKGGDTSNSLAPQIADYQSRQKPSARANFSIDGYAG